MELTGFEPVTYWLQTSRSNQLSYSPAGASLRANGADSTPATRCQCVPTMARSIWCTDFVVAVTAEGS